MDPIQDAIDLLHQGDTQGALVRLQGLCSLGRQAVMLAEGAQAFRDVHAPGLCVTLALDEWGQPLRGVLCSVALRPTALGSDTVAAAASQVMDCAQEALGSLAQSFQLRRLHGQLNPATDTRERVASHIVLADLDEALARERAALRRRPGRRNSREEG